MAALAANRHRRGGVVLGWPVLIAFAMVRLPATHAAVVVGVLPALTAAFAALRGRERATPAFWAASVAGLVAVVVFALVQGGGSFHAADLLLLGSVVLCAWGSLKVA
ncbi:hypothetical protein [Kibdelosporangium aridum]|uniref:hypothetical protein n=1 Tax=Kibdelosporangium aridum TaxID=2030 RepID=UPI000F782E23|nr:hypothetical protein [Kibdelosporangium aridum]